MKKIYFLISFVFLAIFKWGVAQEVKKLQFTGSVDAYAKLNFNADSDQAPSTSFANKSGFAIGMVNLITSYEGEKVGFVGDLVFGPRGADAVFNSKGSANIVNQLYVYWNLSPKIKVTFGNFNTFLGYEVISPTGNFNYSTSYAFSYGPFSHTGAKLDYEFTSDFTFMLGIFNATDNTEFNSTGNYTIGSQVGYKGQYLNFLWGDQGGDEMNDYGALFQIDYTGGFDIGSKFYLGINATHNSTKGKRDTTKKGYTSLVLYPQYKLNEKVSLGLRGEHFVEDGDFTVIGRNTERVTGAGLTAITGTLKYAVAESLEITTEFRWDNASEKTFVKNGKAQNSIASFLFAAVYSF